MQLCLRVTVCIGDLGYDDSTAAADLAPTVQKCSADPLPLAAILVDASGIGEGRRILFLRAIKRGRRRSR